MTRVQFLNELYRRLGSLSQEQAEQHLTYYAEMLADRMEEGMTEEEAVASMEDVDTIARRILQDEGTPQPPRYPDPPGRTPFDPPQAPEKPAWDWHLPAKIALWTLAILVAAGSIISRITGYRSEARTNSTVAEAVIEANVVESAEASPDFRIGSDGIYIADGEYVTSIGPEGILVDEVDGENVFYIGPEGIQIGGKGWSYQTGAGSYDYAGDDYKISASGIENIEIEWAAGMVEIMPSDDGDTIWFHEDSARKLGDDTKLAYEVNGKTLHISSWKRGRKAGVKLLTLLVPESLLNSLTVDTTSAEVSIGELRLNELCIDTTSGNVGLGPLAAYSADISSTSGNILFNDVEIANLSVDTTSGTVGGTVDTQNLVVDTTSGDAALYTKNGQNVQMDTISGELFLTAEGRSVSNIRMDTTSGSVTLCLAGDLDFQLNFDTTSGRLDTGNFRLLRQNGKYINGSGSCGIDVSTVSGSLALIQN